MVVSGEENIGAEVMPLEIVWRNPQALVQAHFRTQEASNPYFRWAEQATRIRARRANWDANHTWAA